MRKIYFEGHYNNLHQFALYIQEKCPGAKVEIATNGEHVLLVRCRNYEEALYVYQESHRFNVE